MHLGRAHRSRKPALGLQYAARSALTRAEAGRAGEPGAGCLTRATLPRHPTDRSSPPPPPNIPPGAQRARLQ
jgi:hypothetical protein